MDKFNMIGYEKFTTPVTVASLRSILETLPGDAIIKISQNDLTKRDDLLPLSSMTYNTREVVLQIKEDEE